MSVVNCISKTHPMHEQSPDRSPLRQIYEGSAPVEFNSFTELANHVHTYLLDDEWENVVTVAKKIYPGTPEEFNAACLEYFRKEFTEKNLSLYEVLKGTSAASVYGLLRHLKIKRAVLNFKKESPEVIASLESMVRVVVRIIVPKLLGWINQFTAPGYQLTISDIENVLGEIIIVEGWNQSDVERVLTPGMIPAGPRLSPVQPEVVARYYWYSLNNGADLSVIGEQLNDQYGWMVSPADVFIASLKRTKAKAREAAEQQGPIRWNRDKLDELVVFIYRSYKKAKPRQLCLSKGKGFWDAAQKLFVDVNGREFDEDFGRRHSELNEKSEKYMMILKHVQDILSAAKKSPQVIPMK